MLVISTELFKDLLNIPICSLKKCMIEVSATSRSLFQRSPTESSVSVCDLETSRMDRSRPEQDCCLAEIKKNLTTVLNLV